jgi:hypothetical protein
MRECATLCFLLLERGVDPERIDKAVRQQTIEDEIVASFDTRQF